MMDSIDVQLESFRQNHVIALIQSRGSQHCHSRSQRTRDVFFL